MIHPMITSKLAEAHRQELFADAEQERVRREIAGGQPHSSSGLLVAIAHLLALPGRQTPMEHRRAYGLGNVLHAKHEVP